MENVVKEENDALKAHYESFGEKWESTDELNKSGIVKQIEERGKNSRIRVVEISSDAEDGKPNNPIVKQ